MKKTIIILDFGSQYTNLIAKSVARQRVECEILPHSTTAREIAQRNPAGIIFSGSPASPLDPNAPICDKEIFQLQVPILGICYGMQLIAAMSGGTVKQAEKKEFGYHKVSLLKENPLFHNMSKEQVVWMSHGCIVSELPPDFECIATSDNAPISAIYNVSKNIYGVQFHPEVTHTEQGLQMFKNFLFRICHLTPQALEETFVEDTIKNIRKTVKDASVILGVSGGVDSTVTAMLLHRAVGKQAIPILVDTGLMRKNEVSEIIEAFEQNLKIKLHAVNAAEIFFERLKGVVDPEQKRKIIGNLFVEVFEREAKNFENVKFLAQGTLYPDVIESNAAGGPATLIKSHHNVAGLPERMNLRVIEPLRNLFKNEVRELGKQLGLPENMLKRHPFPGPGLAVRIIGEVNKEKVALLQKIDSIFIEELKANMYYDKVWQAFAVLLPISSVGIMGDKRTYGSVCALRAVNSLDGMTADWSHLPHDLLRKIANRIINEVPGINRVVYDISSKPPSTIEWE
ncbi:MAG: glutamine-hydrolyzing GMP synthase [Candidatus Cloacimonadia bacterium]